MAVDHPAQITRPVRPQQVGNFGLRPLAEKRFDGLHGLNQLRLLDRRQVFQQRGDFPGRAGVELAEDLPSLGAQRKKLLATVDFGGRRFDQRFVQTFVLEFAQNATQVAGIERFEASLTLPPDMSFGTSTAWCFIPNDAWEP